MIFFARYEASQYGSPYIETEHLLLGLLREDSALTKKFLSLRSGIESIREEIEVQITRRERISTSVEVPLSAECKRILNEAAEEASRLGHKHVGTEHLLLGILAEENCFAARLLRERGLTLDSLREDLRRPLGESRRQAVEMVDLSEEIVSVARLVEVWGNGETERFARMFGEEGQFVDPNGNLAVGRKAIEAAVDLIFSAPGWAKTSGKIEDVQFVGSRAVVVTMVWEIKEQTAQPNPGCVRMTVILTQKVEGWSITRAQATGLQPQSRSAAG